MQYTNKSKMKNKSRKLFLLVLFVMMAVCNMCAENYPYRSDFLWVTVPDHTDWLYKTGEKAQVEVQLYRYGVAQDGEVTYTVCRDMLDGGHTGKAVLKHGRAVVDMGTRRDPGFLDLRLTAKIGGATTTHHVKVGFSVDKIQPYTKEPSDFMTFWQKELYELKSVPLSYTIDPAHEYDTDKADAYLVRLDVNKQGQCIYGYLFIPNGHVKGSCPVVLCPPGAGVKTIKEPLRHRYYADSGCIRFEMEIHGLDPRMSDRQFKEISKAFNTGANGYLCQGLYSRDDYYMKHVYLGLVRAIDFLTSLPEWDGKNVAVQGGSQGGALSLVAAALDSRVTLCCANHPALADMAAYRDKGRTGGYPHMQRIGVLNEQTEKTLQYYDVVNFARHISCPVRMTWGYNDNTCPPTTSYAVWNVLRCPKSSLITPVNEHWTSDATEREHCEWILSNLIK